MQYIPGSFSLFQTHPYHLNLIDSLVTPSHILQNIQRHPLVDQIISEVTYLEQNCISCSHIASKIKLCLDFLHIFFWSWKLLVCDSLNWLRGNHWYEDRFQPIVRGNYSGVYPIKDINQQLYFIFSSHFEKFNGNAICLSFFALPSLTACRISNSNMSDFYLQIIFG